MHMGEINTAIGSVIESDPAQSVRHERVRQLGSLVDQKVKVDGITREIIDVHARKPVPRPHFKKITDKEVEITAAILHEDGPALQGKMKRFGRETTYTFLDDQVATYSSWHGST